MGRHRADDADQHDLARNRVRLPGQGRRTRWPIAVIAVVVVVVLGWFGWSWLSNTMNQKAAAAPNNCPGGSLSVQIDAAPEIAGAVAYAASQFAGTGPVVNDQCVRVTVAAASSTEVLTGLTQGWDIGKLGPKPQAWIADSALWTNQLAATKPTAVGDTAQSVATSPIVLATTPDAAKAMLSAGTPTWTQLVAITSKADGWAGFAEARWGQFTLALPAPASNAASALAVATMLDPPSPQGQAPLTADLLNTPAVRQDLDNLAGNQPSPAPANTHAALLALGRADGISTAPFSAVPTTEIGLYQRNLGVDGDAKPANVADEVRLSGPTPCADYPYLPLAGDWVTSDQVAAAQHFRDYLLSPAGQAGLAKAGFRVSGSAVHPQPAPGMDWGDVAAATTPTDAAGYQQLISAWQAAGQPNR